MSIEYALLGFIEPQPAHGYEIYQQLRAPSGLWQVWRMKQSQLYALLARLEGKGLLSATLEPQTTRPPRKVFSLTQQGQRVFGDWLASPVEHGRQMRLEFLAKLYFALRIDQEGGVDQGGVDQGGGEKGGVDQGGVDQSGRNQLARRLIATQRELCLSWQEDVPFSALPADASPFSRTVSAFRRTQIDAFLLWLDECERLVS